MELLDVGVRSKVGIDDSGVDELLVITLTHGTDAEEEVVEVGCGDDCAEESETNTCALCLNVVVDIGGTEESVVVDLQTVVLIEHFAPFFANLRRVGCGEDEADVVYEVVNLVFPCIA